MGYDSFIGNDPDHPLHQAMTTTILDAIWEKYMYPTVREACWLDYETVDQLFNHMAEYAEAFGIKSAIQWCQETSSEIKAHE
jgi:hypothetical protein